MKFNNHVLIQDVLDALVDGNTKNAINRHYINVYRLGCSTTEQDIESTSCLIEKLGMLMGISINTLGCLLDAITEKEKGSSKMQAFELFRDAFNEQFDKDAEGYLQHKAMSKKAFEVNINTAQSITSLFEQIFGEARQDPAVNAATKEAKEALNAIFGMIGGEPDAPASKD